MENVRKQRREDTYSVILLTAVAITIALVLSQTDDQARSETHALGGPIFPTPTLEKSEVRIFP